MTFVTWLLTALFAGWCAVRLLGLERGWPPITALAFTPYVAAASPIPLVLAGLVGNWWAAGVAGAAMLGLAAAVLPRATGRPTRDGAGGTPARNAPARRGRETDAPVLHAMTLNMLHGQADPDAVVTLVRDLDVDLLALQEYPELARKKLTAAGLDDLLPYRTQSNGLNGSGSALYSRYPLADPGIHSGPGGYSQPYGTVRVPVDGEAPVLVPGETPVEAHSVHPSSPYAPRQIPRWWSDLASQPAASPRGPVRLLLGDFNSTLDHVPLRRLLKTGYRDAAAATGNGLTITWRHERWGWLPGAAIDHILVDRRIGVRRTEVHRVPGSDHRALFAELVLPAVVAGAGSTGPVAP